MDTNHFDQMTKLIARRRLSRRQAFSTVAPALTAGLLGVAGIRQASAEDVSATPSAGEAEKLTYMFVQSFQSGSIGPKEGSDDTYTVTLEQGTGQTIYFADRPSRDVGTVATGQFLQGLGFSEDNPPNAAIVIDTGDGETDIAVVELLNPDVSADGTGVTYDVQFLDNWEDSLEWGFSEAPADLPQIATDFGAAHLFIDDCPSVNITCCPASRHGGLMQTCELGSSVGTISDVPFCWHLGLLWCEPCQPDFDGWDHIGDSYWKNYWSNQCDAAFSSCDDPGGCRASW
jgi:hypothetical protein